MAGGRHNLGTAMLVGQRKRRWGTLLPIAGKRGSDAAPPGEVEASSPAEELARARECTFFTWPCIAREASEKERESRRADLHMQRSRPIAALPTLPRRDDDD